MNRIGFTYLDITVREINLMQHLIRFELYGIDAPSASAEEEEFISELKALRDKLNKALTNH